MRWIAGLLILLLGGCGVAVSDKPMLDAADTTGAPQLEEGVWLMPAPDEEKHCPVDTARPVSKWPKCANWAVYRDGRWFERDGDTGIATKPVHGSVVVAGGDVAIVQIEYRDPDDVADEAPTYFFAAFDNKPAPTAKLRSVKLWIVMCGTYRHRNAAAEDESDEALVRYPGFDDECRPASTRILRDAADASRSAGTKMAQLRWVRATLD